MLSDIPLYALLLWFCLCPLAIVSRQDAFGLVLASGDIGMPHCRQLETFNTLILFNKNDFGLSRRFKATYLQASGDSSRKGNERNETKC
ncbi:TPA: hypothetical protein R4Y05_002051 [Serratia liquefaciens]|nr:hypothetical protein [Serratia liquefaciens]